MLLRLFAILLLSLLCDCSANNNPSPQDASLALISQKPQAAEYTRRINELSNKVENKAEKLGHHSIYKIPYKYISQSETSNFAKGLPFFTLEIVARTFNVPIPNGALNELNRQWSNAWVLDIPPSISRHGILSIIKTTLKGFR